MTEVTSDLKQLQIAFRYQLRSYLRTWRFVGLLVFVAVISAAILAVQLNRGADAVLANNPTSSDYLSTYLSFLPDAIIITAAFLGGDALAVDLSGGPGYLMLAQPVRRSTLLSGRFLAATVTGAAVGLVYYGFSAAAAQYFYGDIPTAILYSVGLAALFLVATLAVAFFFSSFFRSPVISLVASLLILIIGFPLLTAIGTLTGVEPWFSLDYGSQAITSVLNPNFVHESVTHTPAGRRGLSIAIYSFSPYPWEGAAILAVYLAAFLALAYVMYRYKEVKG
jgi:ABC-2 type transport system permease protein